MSGQTPQTSVAVPDAPPVLDPSTPPEGWAGDLGAPRHAATPQTSEGTDYVTTLVQGGVDLTKLGGARVTRRAVEGDLRRRERLAEVQAADTARRLKAERRAALRAERRAARQARADARAEWVRDRLASASHNFAGLVSSGIYTAALSVAVTGQATIATTRHWPLVFGIGMAVFIEGMAVSMALTAHQLRLRGERALIPRALTWVFAGLAAFINYVAHYQQDRVLAYALGMSSVAAITLFEIRSGARNRPALREAGMIPDPPEQFGWRRWLRHPLETLGAWSVDVRTRVSPRGAALLANAEARRSYRREIREHRRLVTAARRAVIVAAARRPGAGVVEQIRVATAALTAETPAPPALPEIPARPRGGARPSGRQAPRPPARLEVTPPPAAPPALPPAPPAPSRETSALRPPEVPALPNKPSGSEVLPPPGLHVVREGDRPIQARSIADYATAVIDRAGTDPTWGQVNAALIALFPELKHVKSRTDRVLAEVRRRRDAA
jgi:hypothetical protein